MNAMRLQPLLLDTSAESRLPRILGASEGQAIRQVMRERQIAVSAITILERIRGFSLARERAEPSRWRILDEARLSYLSAPRTILPVDGAVAVISGELMALLPQPPSPPKRNHRGQENRAERLARWRFDIMIAATALVSGSILIHENAADFDAIRDAVNTHAARFPDGNGLVTCRLGDISALLA